VLSSSQNQEFIDIVRDINQKLGNGTTKDIVTNTMSNKKNMFDLLTRGATTYILFHDAIGKAYGALVTASPHLKPFAEQILKFINNTFS
jgi:hypothetical protein